MQLPSVFSAGIQFRVPMTVGRGINRLPAWRVWTRRPSTVVAGEIPSLASPVSACLTTGGGGLPLHASSSGIVTGLPARKQGGHAKQLAVDPDIGVFDGAPICEVGDLLEILHGRPDAYAEFFRNLW